MMKLIYFLFIIFCFFTIDMEEGWTNILLKLLVITIVTLLSTPYKGIKLDKDKETFYYGVGILTFFKINKTYKKSEIKKIAINQLENLYYGIDMELQNGEKITLKKVVNLNKAKNELVELENKIVNLWS